MIRTNSRIAECLLLVVAVLPAAILAGCGGGGTPAASQVAKSQFIKRADRICKETELRQEEEVRAYAAEQGPRANLAEESQAVQVVVTVGLPSIRREIKELRALRLPGQQEDAVRRYLSEMEAALEAAESNPKSVLVAATSPFRAVEAKAPSYGFKVCRGA